MNFAELRNTDIRTRLVFVSAFVLLLGMGCAVFIYLFAVPEDESDSVFGYKSVGGVKPEDTKIYRHQVELYGGKAALMAVSFNHWFAGLWQGRRLAFTVIFFTLVISSVILFVAKRLDS